MKTERRHELQKNQLADWLGHKIAWCEQNARVIFGVVFGLIVVAGVFAYYNHSRTESRTAAWSTYFDAVEARDPVGRQKGWEKLANTEIDMVPGQLAEILLADVALSEGIDQLATDREAGEKRLNEAKTRYIAARDAADDKKLKDRATLGLARFYESMGLVEDALQQYRLLADSPESLYRDEAVRKLDYLGKPSTLHFAKWYHDRKPAPQPGGTGLFDRDALQTMPQSEASFPGATPAAATPSPAVTSTTPAAATTSATPSATAGPKPTPSPSASPSPSATPSRSPLPSASPSPTAKS